jgi:hypothetical protein
MTDPIAIPVAERHHLRLFAMDLPKPDLDRLSRPDPTNTAATATRADLLAALLGVATIDADFVEVFDVADLADLGLAGYLAEGGNIPEVQIAPDRDRLDAVRGAVIVLFSRATRGEGVTLYPDPRLTLIGTYVEDVPPVFFEPLPTAATEGTLNPVLPPLSTPPAPRRLLAILGAGLIAVVVILIAILR